MRVLSLFLVQTALLLCSALQSQGQIRGQVVDSEGASISRTTIRVMDAKSRKTIRTGRTDAVGRFELHDLSPGRYSIAFSSSGFSPELIEVDTSLPGADLSRTVHLRMLDCDAPKVNCDVFTQYPIEDPHPIVFQGDLNVDLSASVDLDKGGSVPLASRTANFSIAEKEGGLYLTPLNGATLLSVCKPEFGRGREKAAISEVRIDGLDPDSEICMKTIHFRFSKIFITREVRSEDKGIEIDVVTRDK